jgi:hypothetical protein
MKLSLPTGYFTFREVFAIFFLSNQHFIVSQ